jgi:hypothetical protein
LLAHKIPVTFARAAVIYCPQRILLRLIGPILPEILTDTRPAAAMPAHQRVLRQAVCGQKQRP